LLAGFPKPLCGYFDQEGPWAAPSGASASRAEKLPWPQGVLSLRLPFPQEILYGRTHNQEGPRGFIKHQ